MWCDDIRTQHTGIILTLFPKEQPSLKARDVYRLVVMLFNNNRYILSMLLYMFVVDAIEKKRRGVNPPPPLPSFQPNNYLALGQDNVQVVR